MRRLLFHPRCAVFSALVLSAVGLPMAGQAAHQCAFNGVWEACSLRRVLFRGKQEGTRVTWLSDGKVVTYYYMNCFGDHGGSECKVEIVEDNGRVTWGRSSHGGRGTWIKSERGNVTIIPPF